MRIRQQGDVIFFKVDSILDNDLKKEDTDVVQWGEVTNHKHQLYNGEFELLNSPSTKQRYLRVVRETELRHEEHKAFKIEPGVYRIGIVREVDHLEKLVRPVID